MIEGLINTILPSVCFIVSNNRSRILLSLAELDSSSLPDWLNNCASVQLSFIFGAQHTPVVRFLLESQLMPLLVVADREKCAFVCKFERWSSLDSFCTCANSIPRKDTHLLIVLLVKKAISPGAGLLKADNSQGDPVSILDVRKPHFPAARLS